MRAGKIGSFLSCAVSTNILKGPFGQRTATKSNGINDKEDNATEMEKEDKLCPKK